MSRLTLTPQTVALPSSTIQENSEKNHALIRMKHSSYPSQVSKRIKGLAITQKEICVSSQGLGKPPKEALRMLLSTATTIFSNFLSLQPVFPTTSPEINPSIVKIRAEEPWSFF